MIALSLTLVGCWKSKMSIFCRACYHNALPFTQITEISIDNKVHLLLAPLSITRPKPFYGLRMGRVLLWPPTLSSVPHRPTACPLQPLSPFYNSWLLCNTTQCSFVILLTSQIIFSRDDDYVDTILAEERRAEFFGCGESEEVSGSDAVLPDKEWVLVL